MRLPRSPKKSIQVQYSYSYSFSSSSYYYYYYYFFAHQHKACRPRILSNLTAATILLCCCCCKHYKTFKAATLRQPSPYLRPVGHVPPRLAGRPLALLLCGGSVVGEAIVGADDSQNRTQLLHANHVAFDYSVTTRHCTLQMHSG